MRRSRTVWRTSLRKTARELEPGRRRAAHASLRWKRAVASGDHERDREDDLREEVRPEHGEPVALEQQAAQRVHEVARGDDAARGLERQRHVLEREDHAGEEQRRQERRERARLRRDELVLRDDRDEQPLAEHADEEEEPEEEEQRRAPAQRQVERDRAERDDELRARACRARGTGGASRARSRAGPTGEAKSCSIEPRSHSPAMVSAVRSTALIARR